MQQTTRPAVDPTRGATASALPRVEAWPSARARPGAATWRAIKRSWQLYVMLVLPLLWLAVFAYYPMWGAQIAFRDYNVVAGITGSPWVGLKHFERFVDSYNFWPILKNTLILNLYQLAVSLPLP